MTPDQEERLLQLVDETHGQVLTMAAHCEHCTDTLRDHHTTLYGNGRTGLKDRMTAVEQKVASSESADKWIREKMSVALLIILGLVASAVGLNQAINRIFPAGIYTEAPSK